MYFHEVWKLFKEFLFHFSETFLSPIQILRIYYLANFISLSEPLILNLRTCYVWIKCMKNKVKDVSSYQTKFTFNVLFRRDNSEKGWTSPNIKVIFFVKKLNIILHFEEKFTSSLSKMYRSIFFSFENIFTKYWEEGDSINKILLYRRSHCSKIIYTLDIWTIWRTNAGHL